MVAPSSRSLAPIEPISPTAGVTPAFTAAARPCAMAGEAPAAPDNSVLRRTIIAARTSSTGSGGPDAWARPRSVCSENADSSDSDSASVARLPRPVVTP
jgi:hypothetical protein